MIQGNERAPWRDLRPDGTLGPERLPVNPRTGRPCSQTKAEREFVERYGSLHAVPVAEEFEILPSARPAHRLYDTDHMQGWARKHSHRLSGRELDVYVAYWIERRSVSQTASYLAMQIDNVRGLIKKIRRKARSPRPPLSLISPID